MPNEMPLNLDEKKIRLSGSANIDQELNIDQNYDLMINNAEVVESKDMSNNDGTFNRIYKVKINETSSVMLANGQEVVKSIDKKSMSQKLRAVIWERWNTNYTHIDFDVFYNQEMGEIIKQQIARLS